MSTNGEYGELEIIEATPEQRAEHYRTQPRLAVSISDIKPEYPNPVLAATGNGNGAVLTAGNVGLLAGEGGIAKSALTISLALSYAYAGLSDTDNPKMKQLTGAIFEGTGGRVMMVNYEDTPGTLSAKMQKLSTYWQIPEQARENVFVQNLIGKPLYTTTKGLTRLDPTTDIGAYFIDDGWEQLWREIDRITPSLVIIDPCLSAFTGNQNDPGEVRYFLMSIAERAQFSGYDMGVLMVAHSNKDARGKDTDPYEPGKVSGTTQWIDSVRGVMTIDWHPDKENRPSDRILRIPKANLGRSRICLQMDTIRADSGEILGFETVDRWADKEPPTESEGQSNGESDQYNGVI